MKSDKNKKEQKQLIMVSLICLIILSFLISTFSSVSVKADELVEVQNQIDDLLAQKENVAYERSLVEADLYGLQNLKTTSEDSLAWLNERNTEQQEAYTALKEKQDLILTVQASYLENLDVSKQNYDTKVEQYGDRIETMFGMHNKSIFELFLESDSLEGFFTSVKFMRIITDEDEAALEDLEEAHDNLIQLTQDTQVIIDENNQELDEIDEILAGIEADINYQIEEITLLDTSISDLEGQIDLFVASESEIQWALAEADANMARIEEEREAERLAAEQAAAEAAAAAEAEAARLAAQATQPVDPMTQPEFDDSVGGYPVVEDPGYVEDPQVEEPIPSEPQIVQEPVYYGSGLAWPVPSSYMITSYFGYRTFGGYSDFHTGTDIGAPTGTPVVAPAPGTITYAGWMDVGGNTVMIDHGNGMTSMYCHLSGFGCSVGQVVSTGETICYIGSTGFSTGPHLHYEIRINGVSVDPLTYY
ncbi:MAG: peptidoglycan DD-metalloendopeptidase family protein [Clostridiaceae bacterium]|nr:peptidoglycan DD-metalloendopeptidase family protein [Clostridiaceae bacterium]